MKVLKLLYKYRYEVKLNKTKLFEFVNNGSKEIEQEGFVYKVKNPWDLFAYEVILKGIRAKKEIDQCYNNFIALCQDCEAVVPDFLRSRWMAAV